jgi:hypothetical protein
VVHQGQRLPFGLKPGENRPAVQPRLDELERHEPPDGGSLLGHPDRAHTAFPDHLQQLVRADDFTGIIGGRLSVRHGRSGRAVEEAAGLGMGAEQGFRPIVQGRVVGAFPTEKLVPLLRREPQRCDEQVSGALS